MNHIGFRNRGFQESLSRFSSLDYMQRYVEVNIKKSNEEFKNMIIDLMKKSLKDWGKKLAIISVVLPLTVPVLNGYVKPLVYNGNNSVSKSINTSIESLNKKIPTILKNGKYYIDYNNIFDKYSTNFYDNIENNIGITSPKRNMEFNIFNKELSGETVDLGLTIIKNINIDMTESALREDSHYKELHSKLTLIINYMDNISKEMDKESRNKFLNDPFVKASNILGS